MIENEEFDWKEFTNLAVEYIDDNKRLYEAYNEFCNKYEWAPKGQRLMLVKNDDMIDLEDFKGFAENGINDGDKICILKNWFGVCC